MAKHDAAKSTYYLDSCVLIDLIEHPETVEPAKTIFSVIADAQSGRFNLVTSTIAITEVLMAKSEKDRRAIDPDVEAKINKLWHPTSPIQLVEVHELIAKAALQLFREAIPRGWGKTRGNDVIHLVTAQREKVSEFFTNDAAMFKWEPIVGFRICAPHYEPDPGQPTPDPP